MRILTTLQFKNYVSANVTDVDNPPIVPSGAVDAKFKRDGNEYHVTIIDPIEYHRLGLSKDDYREHQSVLKSDYKVVGVGKQTNANKICWFYIIDWKSAQTFRSKFGLGEKDFHVTLGFINGDVHGKPKDKSTLIKESVILEGKEREVRAMESFLKQTVAKSPFAKKVYLVGGAVRDQLRGKNPKDLDLVIAEKDGGIRFAEWICKQCGVFKPGSNPVTYPRFGTAKFQLYGVVHDGVDIGDLELETVMTRSEEYTSGSRKPKVDYGSIKQDALRRDLTFNAIYKQIDTGKIFDPLQMGIADLNSNTIRTTSDPGVIFEEDPLRMLRAIRFAVRDNGKMASGIIRTLKDKSASLKTISNERIIEELNKILLTAKAYEGIKLLLLTGLMKYIVPTLKDSVTLKKGLSKTSSDLPLRLAVLLYDVSNPAKLMHELKYASNLSKEVDKIVKIARTITPKIRETKIRELISLVGTQTLLDAISIREAFGDNFAEVIKSIRSNRGIETQSLPLNGNDVMQLLGLEKKDGKRVGQILTQLKYKWFKNPKMTRDEAEKFVKSLKI